MKLGFFNRPARIRWSRPVKLIVALLLGSILAVLAAPWLLRGWVHWREQDNVFTPQTAPANAVALVLGAGLQRDGTPTAVLRDRVVTAVELYQTGAVKKLLLSGDNRFVTHNEPEAMRQLALKLGVPAEDMVLDYAGRRTYDSCYRARDIFQVSRVTIVTQRFHLDRALYLCNGLGLEAVGVAADQRAYRSGSARYWELREVAATVRAWLDIHLLRPVPVLGEKIPIEIANNSQ